MLGGPVGQGQEISILFSAHHVHQCSPGPLHTLTSAPHTPSHLQGVFSSVLRARDLSRRDHDTGAIPEVAIKVRLACVHTAPVQPLQTMR